MEDLLKMQEEYRKRSETVMAVYKKANAEMYQNARDRIHQDTIEQTAKQKEQLNETFSNILDRLLKK